MLHSNLPDINQLNYHDHIGKIYQGIDGEYYQVQCARKNKSMNKSNCECNSDDSIKLKWVSYNKKVNDYERIYMTPLGIFSYDQLMNMPRDMIEKIKIILDLLPDD